MEFLLGISLALSFLVVLFSVPIWINRAKKAGLVGKDIHKKTKNNIAEAGGVSVLLGFLLGVLSYIALRTFYLKDLTVLIEIFALLNVILIISLIGLIDDVLGWKIGLTRRIRILFLFH